MASQEKLTLYEQPGVLRSDITSIQFRTPFVTAMALGGGPTIFRYDFERIAGDLTETAIQLPAARARRAYELFRRLFSTDRELMPYDAFSAVNFMAGETDSPSNAQTRRYNYAVRPVANGRMEVGEPYAVVNDRFIGHAALAIDGNHALHVAGPTGGFARTNMLDIAQLGRGQLHHIDAFVRP